MTIMTIMTSCVIDIFLEKRLTSPFSIPHLQSVEKIKIDFALFDPASVLKIAEIDGHIGAACHEWTCGGC
jgi:hypothetical protein